MATARNVIEEQPKGVPMTATESEIPSHLRGNGAPVTEELTLTELAKRLERETGAGHRPTVAAPAKPAASPAPAAAESEGNGHRELSEEIELAVGIDQTVARLVVLDRLLGATDIVPEFLQPTGQVTVRAGSGGRAETRLVVHVGACQRVVGDDAHAHLVGDKHNGGTLICERGGEAGRNLHRPSLPPGGDSSRANDSPAGRDRSPPAGARARRQVSPVDRPLNRDDSGDQGT